MKAFKLILTTTLFCAVANCTYAQQNPTTNSPAGIPSGTNDKQFWSRAGNTSIGGLNNIFGTMFNSPIHTFTDGIQRTILNGTQTPTIQGVPVNTSGFMGLGDFGNSSPLNNANGGPWTLLHLQGPHVSFGNPGGWRPWMSTGAFITENSDAMYVGMKREQPSNQSDAVINWMDDPTIGGGGVDKLRFIFTAASPNGNGNGTNPRDGKNLNGYEFMRMVSDPNNLNSAGYPVGYVGIGPVFTNALTPMNRLHMNAEDNLKNFVQITNEAGTLQSKDDGFHLGIPATSVNNHPGFIINKENDRIVLFTNSTPTVDYERMRIMHIGAQNNNVAFNPGALPNNLTRVSISHDPTQPVDKPLSLLHLGYNTQGPFNAGTSDGWRSWMDVGTFTASGSDNMYFGLKKEVGGLLSGNDRWDAIINWGDNEPITLPPGSGPDNLRFIFTSTTTGIGTTFPGNSPTGIEGMRMTPTLTTGGNTHIFTGIGGDPQVNLYVGGSILPTQTLEVNSPYATNLPGGSSGLRFTNLNTSTPFIANPGLGLLSVNANGDVIYVSAPSFGAPCGAAVAYNLPTNWRVGLNNFAFNFPGLPIVGGGRINIGDLNSCTMNVARLFVRNSFGGINPPIAFQAEQAPTILGLNWAGFFNGNVHVTGIATVGSDARLKTNIVPLASSISNLKKLVPISYFFNPDTANFYSLGLPLGAQQFGFTAQNIDSIFPQLVVNATRAAIIDSNNNIVVPSITYKSVNFNGLIPITVKAIQEQQLQIDSLKNAPAGSGDVKAGAGIQNNYLTKWSNTSTKEISNSLFYDDGNFTGIGTTSTGARLQIKGTGNGTFTYGLIATDNANNPLLYLHDNGQMDLNTNNSNYAQQINLSTADNNSNGSFVTNTVTNASSSGNNIGYRSAVTGNFPGSQIGFRADLNNTTGSNSGTDIVVNGSSAQGGSTENNGYTFSVNKGIRNRGLFGNAVNADQNTGVLVSASYNDLSQPQSTRNYGAQFLSSNASIENYGILSQSISTMTSGTNYGIYASASGATTNYAGFFQGDVFITGSGFVNGGIPIASDQMFKTNISPLTNALAKIDQLNPKTFYYDTTNAYGLKFNGQKQSGFVAQDLITVFPEMVNTITKPAQYDSAGNVIHAAVTFKNVNYNGLHAYEIESIKELKKKIDTQDSLIQQMSNTINSCCSNAGVNGRTSAPGNINQIDIELTDANFFYLLQNQPNPFSDKTTIGFNVPDFKNSAVINFYNNNGELIKSVNVAAKGRGQLNVSISELANGMYSYSLVVDGSIKATKKMIKQE